MEPDLRSLCILARAPALDAARLHAAAARAGGLGALLRASARELAALGLAPATALALRAPDARAHESDLQAAQHLGLVPLPATSPAYPPQLAAVPGAPHLLWVRGDPGALAAPLIAIVGSRHPTAGGRRTAREFAHGLARAGFTIVSGLARGIDAASHEGALDACGCTVAVCGTGLDVTYPRDHGELADRIAAAGAVISEFPPGTAPLPANFPQRNRIISGLALGVLVVEAAPGSGSLITARTAGEQGRDVFAIPGSIHSPLARGCHRLIREGALLVEHFGEILAEYHLFLSPQVLGGASAPLADPRPPPVPGGAWLDNPSEILLDALGFEPTSVDALIADTGLAGESVASLLLLLELEGRIESHPGGQYSRVPRPPAGAPQANA
ncbi:MAG: DNA-processing protein DprA [Steroidobacteraceae bacterium]